MKIRTTAMVAMLASAATAQAATAYDEAEAHLDCMAVYVFLDHASQASGDLSEIRIESARASYFRSLPNPSIRPMPMTRGEIDMEMRERIEGRGGIRAIVHASGGLHSRELGRALEGCDARYGLPPRMGL